MPGPIDISGFIPERLATTITEEAVQQSMALQLGNRVPMPAGVTVMPVPATFPKAAWIASGTRKPLTDFSFDTVQLTAEEVAATIAIPDAMLEDADFAVWAWARPRLAEAIAEAVDLAVLFGVDAPPTFPVGGVVGLAQTAPAGADPVATISDAMSLVETQGLRPNGSMADITVRGALRGLRDNGGALLLGPSDVSTRGLETLFGVPITYGTMPSGSTEDFITGDWSRLIIGVRQDIRYSMSSEAVIADDQGRVAIAAWQDNVTLMKVWARYGCVIVRPSTRRITNANPFAMASIGPGVTYTAPLSEVGPPTGRAEQLAQRSGQRHQQANDEGSPTVSQQRSRPPQT